MLIRNTGFEPASTEYLYFGGYDLQYSTLLYLKGLRFSMISFLASSNEAELTIIMVMAS